MIDRDQYEPDPVRCPKCGATSFLTDAGEPDYCDNVCRAMHISETHDATLAFCQMLHAAGIETREDASAFFEWFAREAYQPRQVPERYRGPKAGAVTRNARPPAKARARDASDRAETA
jgi:hypothetical protein